MADEVWSFVETAGAGLHRTAAKIASEAARLARLVGGESSGVLACDGDGRRFAEELSAFGLRKLHCLKTESPVHWTPEAYAQALAALAARSRPYLIVFAATALGSEVAARVAARLGSGLISNCVDFSREGQTLVARKTVYGGTAHMTMTWCNPPPHLATVDPESLEAIEQRCESAQPIEETLPIGPLRTEFIRRWKTDPRQLDLTEANLVVGVGRPIIARANELDRLREAAESCGATFGVSRPVVDAGMLPRERQIGASGKWLTADVYIACGVSGSSYHMMGVRGVRHLIAVNNDPKAPIMKQAELGIVADLFEVLPELGKLAEADQREQPESGA